MVGGDERGGRLDAKLGVEVLLVTSVRARSGFAGGFPRSLMLALLFYTRSSGLERRWKMSRHRPNLDRQTVRLAGDPGRGVVASSVKSI